MGLTYVYGCVHTEVCVRHHDRRWVATPNVCWCMVRDALAHAVWLRGEERCTVTSCCPIVLLGRPIGFVLGYICVTPTALGVVWGDGTAVLYI